MRDDSIYAYSSYISLSHESLSRVATTLPLVWSLIFDFRGKKRKVRLRWRRIILVRAIIAPSYFSTRRGEKVRFNWRKRRRGANSRPFDGTRCEMRMNFMRGCKSFSFYNPVGEFLPHVRLSISLSFLQRDSACWGWSVTKYSDALRGIVYGNMEGFRRRNNWRKDENEKYGARGYGRKTVYARCARSEGFLPAFPRSFALSSPRRVSIISHPLSRGNVTSLRIGNHFTKWDPCALMRRHETTLFFVIWLAGTCYGLYWAS